MSKLENMPIHLTVSVKKAVEISGLSRRTIYTLMSQGIVTSTRVGRRRLIHFSSLLNVLGLGGDTGRKLTS